MMVWILMAAVATASFFFGRYYRAEAAKWKVKADELQAALEQAKADERDTAARYEGIIADLKSRLVQLENNIYVAQNPDDIRLLFSQLFPSAT